MEQTPSEDRIFSCLIDSINDPHQDPLIKEKIIDKFIEIIQNTIDRESQSIELVRDKCIICWKNEKTHIFIPCGHYIMCEDCVIKISNMPLISVKCPICRTYGRYHKVFNCHQKSDIVSTSEISMNEQQD